MDTTIEAPKPSEQEQALYDQMLAQIDQYTDYQQMMLPIQMEQAGYDWEWKEGIDPEAMEYVPDQALLDQKTDYQSQVDQLNQEIKRLSQLSGQGQTIAEHKQRIKELTSAMSKIDTQLKEAEEGWEPPQIGDADYGQWRELSDEEAYERMSESERLAYDLQKAQSERSLAAIEGRLDPSQATLDQMQREWEALRETYGTIEGDDWETATASDTVGQQNLQKFKERWTSYLDAVRHGQAGSDIQSAVIGTGLTTDQTRNQIGTTQAIGQGMGGSIPMYQSLLAPYQAYNQMGYQANIYNQANRASQFGSLLGTGTTLASAALLGALSSKKYKKDIKSQSKSDEDKALKLLMKTRSYKYKYKPEVGAGEATRLGTIVEESPKEMVADNGEMIDLGAKIELQSMAIKALARRLEKKRRAS